ncbi:DNA mismatch repair protein MutL [Flexibacter flexilis DSM 6793]|uniref:DNA mismatch repair protein MutL n=1 Tax=Flexibacter flexilis DSM 6793 TaxID=927664 RepID=A0A1I1LN02_9BACT|nr:DNA mismatch repair endonuclease MutL [Flexibacter flexilis]SFC74419.1 DNA mismatch repair protein MutL [Flexibacter flexilis DSM 6793]
MSDIIRLLPDAIANQIAAGEVVQRPASVVKELLENAIDAGSTHIKLIVKDAGRTLIQVIDDGCGMSENDARMCFERHATSKIRTSDDIFNIRTLGFRGEAMASIAAVAQVEMRTRRQTDEVGALIRIEASELKESSLVATPIGTSISVKNLFFNVPARRNFLKSNAVEMRNILEEFNRVALANPQIAFSLHQNDSEVYNLAASKLSQRIIGILGTNYKEQLAPCQEETPHLKISGYVGKPESAKKTRGEQYFFVNNRFVKNNYLHHAVVSAFEGLLQPETHPFYALFIDIDPKHIDINVHPTKTEIKFDDERGIYAMLMASVRKAFSSYNLTPSLDFDKNVNLGMLGDIENPQTMQALSVENRHSYSLGGSKQPTDARQKANTRHWESLYQSSRQGGGTEGFISRFEQEENPVENLSITFGSALNNKPSAMATGKNHAGGSEEKITFQLHNRYILSQVKSGLMLIDQQAAHERILYEKYLESFKHSGAPSQQSLFPTTLGLHAADYALVMEMQDEIQALGFVYESFGENVIVIRGIPAGIENVNERELFDSFLEQFKNYRNDLNLPHREALARALAKRAAMRTGTPLTNVEMNSLITQLFACSVPNYTPDGKAIIAICDMDRLASFFS